MIVPNDTKVNPDNGNLFFILELQFQYYCFQ